jgi:hypothetical protein
MKILIYISASAVFFMPTVSASESLIERQNACAQLEPTGQLTHPELPLVLQPFVCHENLPGLSNNVLLHLTQAQYDEHCSVIARLSYVSFKILEAEPFSTEATQGSQTSIASTVLVDLSQNSSLDSLPPTVPFKP